jgi:predicted MPP superfamily phosphohydrolase
MITASKIAGAIFTILAILLAIDLYSYTGLRAALKSVSKKTRRICSWAYWLINAAFLLSITCTALFFKSAIGFSGWWFHVLAGFFFALYIPKLFFIVFLLLEDAYRLLRAIGVGIYKLTNKDKATSVELFQSRRKFIANTGAIVAAIPFTGVLYGVTKGKYNFKIHKVEIAFKDLPKQFDGLQITQLSDIHCGSFDDKEAVQHAMDLANEQRSDIIFFTGDLVNNITEEVEPWMDVFSKLKAPMGVYSILGNHDYGDYVTWDSAEAKRANLEKLFAVEKQLGYKLLRNENTKLERNGAYIELLGMENWGTGGFSKYGDFKKTLEGTQQDSFKILLSHDPTQWEEQVMNHPTHVHLTLSGHTHGAQLGVELPHLRFSPAQFRYKRWAGLYMENDKYLYVNRGLGFIGFPGRVGIWPEITVITLKTA